MGDHASDTAAWAQLSQQLAQHTPLTLKQAIELTSAIECGPVPIEGIDPGKLFAPLVVLFDPASGSQSHGYAINTLIDLARSAPPSAPEALDEEELEALVMMFIRELAASRDVEATARLFGALLPDPERVRAVVHYAKQTAQEHPGPIGERYGQVAAALGTLLQS